MNGQLFQMGLAANEVNTGKPDGRISGDQDEERLTRRRELRGRQGLMPQLRLEQAVSRGLENRQGREVLGRR